MDYTTLGLTERIRETISALASKDIIHASYLMEGCPKMTYTQPNKHYTQRLDNLHNIQRDAELSLTKLTIDLLLQEKHSDALAKQILHDIGIIDTTLRNFYNDKGINIADMEHLIRDKRHYFVQSVLQKINSVKHSSDDGYRKTLEEAYKRNL